MPGTETEKLRDYLRQLRSKVAVQRVVCTRKVTSQNKALGDTLLSYEVLLEEGVSLDEARVVSLLLGLEVDMAAHNNALAGGIISQERRDVVRSALRNNYNALLSQVLETEPGKTEE